MIVTWLEGGRYTVDIWEQGTKFMANYLAYAYLIVTVELTVITSCWMGRG